MHIYLDRRLQYAAEVWYSNLRNSEKTFDEHAQNFVVTVQKLVASG